MNQKEAKLYGIEHGRVAAEVNFDANKDDDTLEQEAFEAEENARSFTPFEFLARDINECGDRAEGLWEAYDKGVAQGIREMIKLKREDPSCDGPTRKEVKHMWPY